MKKRNKTGYAGSAFRRQDKEDGESKPSCISCRSFAAIMPILFLQFIKL
jgi:hypothetical protein